MATKQTCAGRITNSRYPDVGRQCKKWAVQGSDYCREHGGTKHLVDALASKTNQCTAKSTRSQERCRNTAIKGGTVCRMHGGSSKHVQKRARERLMEMVDPALVQLNRMLEAPTTSDSDRTRIALAVLDRTGYGAGMRLEVEVKPWEQVMQSAFKNPNSMPGIVKTPPPELQALIDPDLDGADVVDAELVEDESDADPFPPSPDVPAPIWIGSAQPPKRRQ